MSNQRRHRERFPQDDQTARLIVGKVFAVPSYHNDRQVRALRTQCFDQGHSAKDGHPHISHQQVGGVPQYMRIF